MNANSIQIDIINESSLSDHDIASRLDAIRAQIEEDFKPLYGLGADIIYVPKGHKPFADHWWLGIFDKTDDPGALGYHSLTSEGLPMGKVFQLTDKQYGEDWFTTLSHEALELLADPYANIVALFQKSNTTGTLVAYEVSDPVQGDTYTKLGQQVSNFVCPAYFQTGPHPVGTKFDFLGRLSNNFPSLSPGGYYSYLSMTKSGGWKQKLGLQVPTHKRRPHNGSRRELRSMDHDERLHSKVLTRR